MKYQYKYILPHLILLTNTSLSDYLRHIPAKLKHQCVVCSSCFVLAPYPCLPVDTSPGALSQHSNNWDSTNVKSPQTVREPHSPCSLSAIHQLPYCSAKTIFDLTKASKYNWKQSTCKLQYQYEGKNLPLTKRLQILPFIQSNFTL